MRKIALLTVPLLILGLIALPLAAQEYKDYGADDFRAEGTATIIQSMGPDEEPTKEEHTHDMGTPDEDSDDVKHTHVITHTHDYESKKMMMETVTHTHAIANHTHADDDYRKECGVGQCVVELHHAHPFEVHPHGEGEDAIEHDHVGGAVFHTHTKATGVFQEGTDSIQLRGSTSVTFGVDLDTNATGFKNVTSAGLKFNFPKRSTKPNEGAPTGQVSAEITLKDFEYTVTSDEGGSVVTKAPTVEAKVNVGEEFTIETFNVIDIDYVKAASGGMTATKLTGSGGLQLGYQIAPVVLKIAAISRDDWVDDPPPSDDAEDADTGNLDNSYAFLGTFGLDLGDQDEEDKPDDIVFKLSYPVQYPTGEDQLGVGAKAEFDLGDVEPKIMFDGEIPADDSGIHWDVGGELTWKLLNESSFKAGLGMHIPAAGESSVGATVTLTEAEKRDAKTNKAESGKDGGLQGLFAELTFGLEDLTGDSNTWKLGVKAHYWDPEGEIRPYFSVGIDSAGEELPFEAGLELRVIELVTTDLKYKSENLIGDNSDKGAVTLGLKVGY